MCQLVLSIAGSLSASPGIPNIFLVQLSDSSTTLRIGYFGEKTQNCSWGGHG
jgi:hypothetical protein